MIVSPYSRGLAIDEDKADIEEFLHARAREFRAVGSHEPFNPGPSVRTSCQKFRHLGLGSNWHGQIVEGAIRGQGWTAQERHNCQRPQGPARLARLCAPSMCRMHTFATRAHPELPSASSRCRKPRLWRKLR